jgi:two-component system, chemotaxis family, sensor histidine kinase and response regulator PixL
MDTEQRVRLNFLEEAEDCFDRLESILLGLANSIIEPQNLDIALRSAHSVKGGAAMMGFTTLSQIAHSLEDFLKILRVRYVSTRVSNEVETLLLQSVDSLRQVSSLNKQGTEVDEKWLGDRTEPIFSQLRQHLGELRSEDEDNLLAEQEDVNPALLMFEGGVEAVLENLEVQITQLDRSQLLEELIATAEELAEFGRMAQLDSFIQLCLSIQEKCSLVSPTEIESLAQQSLTVWQRSHALVSLGRIEKLPSQLEDLSSTRVIDSESIEDENFLNAIAEELSSTRVISSQNPNVEELSSTRVIDSESVEDENFLNAIAEGLSVVENLETLDLNDLQSALTDIELSVPEECIKTNDDEKFLLQALDNVNLEELQTALAIESEIINTHINPESTKVETIFSEKANSIPSTAIEQNDLTFRISWEQIQRSNQLLGELIRERNAINLHLEQLKAFTTLLKERMSYLEKSNQQLRQWYDRASVEGLMNPVKNTANLPLPLSLKAKPISARFDILELDRYSELHSVSQEQIETVVQLQEVSTDIDWSLYQLTQSSRELDRTTKGLQENLTRTQMLSFGEVVKRFPRAIRDLCIQYGKQVELKLEGENTPIDRSMVETLNVVLMHLLRNGFDHGIEDSSTRIANGKSSQGTIKIQASHRGDKIVIEIRDDGGGIDINKIRARLLKMELSQTAIDEMQDAELLELIFEPGFSTADRVTELSGRGVGMDVVRTSLRELRGDIRVETKLGIGTTFTIELPFALFIVRVMLVERNKLVFAVPVDTVREIIEPLPESISTIGNREELLWQQQRIPLLKLEEKLAFPNYSKSFTVSGNPKISTQTILIVDEGTSVAGIWLDRFWSEQDVTIRSIDSLVPLPVGITRSVILGDGRVIPLVDPSYLIKFLLQGQELIYGDRSFAVIKKTNSKTEISNLQNRTVLVIDDSINVRRFLSMTLQKAGYQVQEAKDGREAIDKLLQGLAVGTVICDLEMPRLDGYGFLEEIKSHSNLARIPVVMLTSRSNEKHRKIALNLGASAYFSKPYNEQELLQTLKQFMS